MRGNPARVVGVFEAGGSIPACAGKPPALRLIRVPGRVYPRVCGETALLALRLSLWCGLSPRVRGNPAGSSNGSQYSRSIPACAGKPVPRAHSAAPGQVYPRVCGETAWLCPALHFAQGLSPRVRGNRHTGRRRCGRRRSIPACAGKPRADCSQPPSAPVYPRVCGETW